MERRTQKIQLSLSSQAERYARSDAPKATRLMAARGALPLPPIEIATVLFALMHDPDAEVKTTARESLEGLPKGVAGAVLEGAAHPMILSFFVGVFRDDPAQLAKIALNPLTDDHAIAIMAASPHKEIVEIISNNQERMRRSPEIVDALGSNPLTGRSVIERILTFLGADDVLEDLDGSRDATSITNDEAEAALRAVLGDDFAEIHSQLITEHADDEEIDIDSGSLYQVVQRLSVFQKIQLGRLGNKEARSLLVRDRNKLVAISVVTSPKITESEILSLAQSRNVSDEVLRIISNSRDWTRNYQIKLALATNPKCPQGVAMKFVNYLQDKELRALMRSKDVPKAISTHARRILMKKGKV